jgi:hypothetical protein
MQNGKSIEEVMGKYYDDRNNNNQQWQLLGPKILKLAHKNCCCDEKVLFFSVQKIVNN